VVTVDLLSGAGLAEALVGDADRPSIFRPHQVSYSLGVDAVVEVLSNDQRPAGVQTLVSACELHRVSTFVACGGAGLLFQADGSRLVSLLETLPDMGWARPVTELHLQVQDIAFHSSIARVFQIAPPGMHDGAESGTVGRRRAVSVYKPNYPYKVKPGRDLSFGVSMASYQDVAFCLLEALGVCMSVLT
jgi:hypothetical protein